MLEKIKAFWESLSKVEQALWGLDVLSVVVGLVASIVLWSGIMDVSSIIFQLAFAGTVAARILRAVVMKDPTELLGQSGSVVSKPRS